MLKKHCMKEKTRLKQFIQDRGIKQEWIATRAGIPANTLSRIVTAKVTPSLRVAQKIAKVLGATVDDLWPFEEDGPDSPV